VLASFILVSISCSSIDPTVEESEVAYGDRTAPFGFQIGIPNPLVEEGWRVKDPQFLVGRVVDGFQQLTISRVFGLQVDSPPGGEHLLNNNNEFGRSVLGTRLVVYVYERPTGLTLEAFTDSVRGVAYAAVDERINGQEAKTISYKGTQEPRRPRNASESLIPRHILESDRFFYFILYWDRDPDILRNTLRVLDTFVIIEAR
jgi:hypothetical protein